MTTFKAFHDSRRKVDDLSEHVDVCFNGEVVPGWLYLESFYIYIVERESRDREDNIQIDDDYIVTLGNGEYSFGDDLEAAEKFLWDEFAFAELNHDFRFVRFGWCDEIEYDGYTDGTTWNGFDNIWVTEKVHKQIVSEYDEQLAPAEYKKLQELLAQPQSDERDEEIYCINSFHLVEQDENRLYSYAYGFATQIDEDHYHIVNR